MSEPAFIETPIKPLKVAQPKPKKEIKKVNNKKSAPVAPATPKQPKSIKLSTIWKTLVYTFAVIGVILSAMYITDIFNKVVDSRAHEIIKSQTVAPQSKVNQ